MPIPASHTSIASSHRLIREHEILRVSTDVSTGSLADAAHRVRRAALDWAAKKTVGELPQHAWRLETFEHTAAGRNCSAVRFTLNGIDVWAVRSEDPDKNFADRVWTTEIAVSESATSVNLTIRLIASSREHRPDVDPAVPVILRQLLERSTFRTGEDTLALRPQLIQSAEATQTFIERLLSSERQLPFVVLSTSGWAADENRPMLDADNLARSLCGLCKVYILPATYSRILTDELGKALSVYEGAIRVYWPGFTEDSDPFRHDLILPIRLASQDLIASATRRLRWALALYSVRHVQVLPFATLRSLQTNSRQQALADIGATDKEQLDAANAQIFALRQELKEAEESNQWLSDEHSSVELRAKHAEELNAKAGFRIRQLTSQLSNTGHQPDETIALPNSWEDIEDWCDEQLVGRVELTPQARRVLRGAEYESPRIAAECLLWLANSLYERRVSGGGSVRDVRVLEGILNAPCGSDTYDISWQGETREVDWHVKNGGNTRDPSRCLRIYYFWDEATEQVVVAHLPSHRVTGAS